MSIYGGISVRMGNVKGISITPKGNIDARDVTGCRSFDRNAFPLLRLDVQTGVKMIGAQFSESSGENEWDIHRIDEIVLGMRSLSQGAHHEKNAAKKQEYFAHNCAKL